MSALHLVSYGTLPVGTERRCDKCGAQIDVPSRETGSIRWVNNETAWRNDPSNCGKLCVDGHGDAFEGRVHCAE